MCAGAAAPGIARWGRARAQLVPLLRTAPSNPNALIIRTHPAGAAAVLVSTASQPLATKAAELLESYTLPKWEDMDRKCGASAPPTHSQICYTPKVGG